jgi:PAS domain S-box-containing protein
MDEDAARLQPLRVLLLEDSRFDAELLREALLASWPRAQLQVVRDEAAFAQALRDPPDLVLSDFELPGFSGDQALALSLRVAPGVPFIFVSGVIGEDNAVEMLKRGATDYVSKGRLPRLPLVIGRALREVAQRRGRERAQLQLREANAAFAQVVDALRDYAVVLLDDDGRVRAWNRAAREVFGWEAHEVLGRGAGLLAIAEDRAAGITGAWMAQAREAGRAGVDGWLQRRDGLRLWAEGVLVPLQAAARSSGEPGDGGYCLVVRDATAAYRDAQALREAKEEAERANQAKDRFLAVLSHELRTPLAPIATAAHLLERTASVPPEHGHLLPMIRRNVALEARLIDDLLDLTAISAGKVHLQLRPLDLHLLLRRVQDMVEQDRRKKEIELQAELGAQPAWVTGDEARVQQVLWNLLRNAIKFTPTGGQVRLRTWNEDGWIVLACTDSGIGIDPEALPRIFRAFEQADRDVSQRYGGLGLGLAIARGLVREHGGTLEADSAGRGQGATFTLRLRVHAPQAPAATAGPAVASGAGWRLLLVEDSADAAEALVLLLRDYGYQVTHVSTCAEALRTAAAETFDVVLTDLGLPDGNGIEVGEALSPRWPVVALSGYGASPDLRRTALAGFAGHLVKPADPQAVHAALQKALAGRRG